MRVRECAQMGGNGVCFGCDCARLLWGESLTLYLLLGATCLPLQDTGSPHPHPNVKIPHIRACLVCGGQQPGLVTPHNNPLTARQPFHSQVYNQMTLHSRPLSAEGSSLCTFLSLWHIKAIKVYLCMGSG